MSRTRWSLIGAGFGLLLIAAIGLAVGPRSWPRNDPLPGRPPAAVIALGAGMSTDTTLYHVGRDRLLVAMILTKRTAAPRLITTQQPLGASAVPVDYARRLIDSAGLTDRWIVARGSTETTRDEALRVAATLPRRSAIIVVTSQQHTRRACATFETVGFVVTCAAAGISPEWQERYEFLYEMAAVTKYRLHGWIK